MIYDTGKIDIMAKRNDGGIDLFIVSTGVIDASAETQKILLDKVENYLNYINSSEFRQEFAEVKKDRITIVFELEEQMPELLSELCEKIVLWTNESGVKFSVVA